jgi:hypothetical protein
MCARTHGFRGRRERPAERRPSIVHRKSPVQPQFRASAIGEPGKLQHFGCVTPTIPRKSKRLHFSKRIALGKPRCTAL